MKVSFIGLGIMGHAMAGNLLKNHVELTVYNRSSEKARDLNQAGAKLAATPEDAVADADLVFTMLSEPRVVEELAFGTKGFLAAMKKNAIWADCSTVNPSFSKQAAEEAHNKGIRFLDTPVSGSKLPAEKGELIFLAGGNAEDLKEIAFLLDMMGRKTIHIGPAGLGAAMKMVVNMMMAQAMLAFSESILLGTSLGIDRSFLLETLSEMPVSSPLLPYKAKRIKDNNFSVEFPLEWMQKDLHLASLSAWEKNIALPATNLAKEIFASAKQHGLSREDFSAVFRIINDKSS